MAGYRLLIVDDEKVERNALDFIVQRSGLPVGEIRQAQNGRDALAEADSAVPDIVFMDIKMPGMSGIEAARELKHRHPGTRIVFLTAFTSFDYAREALRIGADDFLVKPATRDQVEEVLSRVMERIAAEERRRRERESERHRLALLTDYLEGELVTSFLIGEVDEEQVQEYLSMMEIRFSSGIAVILRFDFEGPAEDPETRSRRDSLVLLGRKILEDELMGTRFLLNTIRESLFLIMIPAEGTPPAELAGASGLILVRARERIERELRIGVRIGIGEPFEELLRISVSFSQARTALSLTAPDRRTVAYREASGNGNPNANRTGGPDSRTGTGALAAAVRRGDRQEALRMGEEILDVLIQESGSFEELKKRTADLAESIRAHVPEGRDGAPAAPVPARELSDAAGIGDIRLNLRCFLIDLARTRAGRAASAGPIEQACGFLEAHFQEDSSLEDLASHYGLSMFYFSKLFKLRTGLTFIDYLSRLRIRKAKELLRDPGNSIKEVSANVGYHDPNYFARVFRRITGSSPSEFRDRIVL